MTAKHPLRSAAPDELAVRLAGLGLPAAGAQGRQATLPGPLQAFHRALLGAFLTGAGPPDLRMVGWLAADLELEPESALAALTAADLVHADPATGRIRVAYPFSGKATPHRVELDQARFPGSPTVRVDGRDVEPGSEPATEYIVGCRLYRLEYRFAGRPEERWVRETLLEAAGCS
jgi:hypothetical protein